LGRRAGVEPAPRSAGETRDFLERIFSNRVPPLLKHERRHLEQAQFTCLDAEIINIFFHRIADKDDRAHARCNGLTPGFRQDLADLGVAAATIDLAHQLCQLRAVGDPAGGATLVQPTIVHEPDIQTAESCRLAEHVGLQRASHVPCRLPAHGCIERKYQPAAAARGVRRHRLGLGDEGGDVFRG
jgi:hypothetical protein